MPLKGALMCLYAIGHSGIQGLCGVSWVVLPVLSISAMTKNRLIPSPHFGTYLKQHSRLH